MNKIIRFLFGFESGLSVLVGLIIVILPQRFSELLLGQSPDPLGLYMVQLYGSMVAAWAAIYGYYLRTNRWEIFKGFAMSTMTGSIPTVIVLIIILVQVPNNFFNLSYLAFTIVGLGLRVACLINPNLSGLEISNA